MTTWTVFCKGPHDKRGQYSEELDVQARTRMGAIRAAQAILDRDYDPDLKARLAIERIPGYWWM